MNSGYFWELLIFDCFGLWFNRGIRWFDLWERRFVFGWLMGRSCGIKAESNGIWIYCLCFNSCAFLWGIFLIFLFGCGKMCGTVLIIIFILFSELVDWLIDFIWNLFELIGYLLSFFTHILESNIVCFNI